MIHAGAFTIDKVPVGSLLREHSHMLETRESETQAEGIVSYPPLVVHLAKALPGAAVLLARLAEAGAGLEPSVSQTVPFAHG